MGVGMTPDEVKRNVIEGYVRTRMREEYERYREAARKATMLDAERPEDIILGPAEWLRQEHPDIYEKLSGLVEAQGRALAELLAGDNND